MALTAKQIDKLIRTGERARHADGDGLYLKVTGPGAASWEHRYQLDGKRRAAGLGSATAITLAEARELIAGRRVTLKQGIDPMAQRDAELAAKRAAKTTFKAAALEYIEAHRAGWKNAKHGQQWANTLQQYVYPKIGDKPVGEVTTEDVLRVLRPIWTTKPETASRVRGRIELVIDAARALGKAGDVTGINPAAWRGNLAMLLPKRSKASKGHHAALPYVELPAFYKRLCTERNSLSTLALRLTIVTGCRTSEVLNAEWSELDLAARIWTIPAARMKAGEVHRVPLSDEAMRIIAELKGRHPRYLFPGRTDKPLSNMTMLMALRRMGREDLTAHGFRSTFRDWIAEETHYANIIAEMALAHTVQNKAEAAYRRGDLLEKRRAMMQDWSDYCTQAPASNVVQIRVA